MKQSTAQSLLKQNKVQISNLERELGYLKEVASDLWNKCEKGVTPEYVYNDFNNIKAIIRSHKVAVAKASELSKFLKSYTRKFYSV